MSPDTPSSYLDVVYGVLSLSLLWHEGLALLPQVWAHTLTHGLQPIGNPAEQLVHARQICGVDTHEYTHKHTLEIHFYQLEKDWAAEILWKRGFICAEWTKTPLSVPMWKYFPEGPIMTDATTLQSQFHLDLIIKMTFIVSYCLWHEQRKHGDWITDSVKYISLASDS